MAWSDRDIYVTQSNPPPGRTHILENSFGGKTGSRLDEGLGVNVYIAGGTGPGGAVPVTGTLGVQMSLSGATITTDPNVNISSSIPLTTVENFGLRLTGSSTTASLGNGGIFIGQWQEVLHYSNVFAVVQSNRASAVNGFKVQWSPDQTNVICEYALTYDIQPNPRHVFVPNRGRYVRLYYENSNQAQSTFFLSGLARKASNIGDVITADLVPNGHDTAALVKSIITGRSSTGGGTYVDVKVDPAGNILAVITGSVSVTNLPATQSVNLVSSVPLQVSGNVGVSGTASVFIEGTSVPLNVLGTASISNFPAVQTVTGTVTVQGISLSGTTPPEAIPNSLDNIVYVRKVQRFDLSSDTVNYIGYAMMATSPASASWTIKRLSFDASGSLEAQEWSSPSATWNSRASEVYS